MSEIAPDTWQDALTRRLKTLVRLGPLHRIEAVKSHRDSDFSGIDLRTVCLRALDLTIERMGLGGGMTHDELRGELAPLIAQMRPDLGLDDARAVAESVVLDLLNERERRKEFRERYTAFDAGRVVQYETSLRLLRETEQRDGTIVLTATSEAINIYAGMLEYPVEDEQIAAEAVLQSQLHRGRIDDAVRSANRARTRSIEYEQKLQGYLETARRDVKQVDWVNEVLAFLEGARVHLEERQRHEQDILRTIDDKVDAASGDTALQLARLHDIVEECFRRHVQLHRRLIPANQEYLHEQDRQVFRPRLAAALPDLEGAVLRPALELPTGALALLCGPLLCRFQPPRPPPLLRLSTLVDRLLAPRRDVEGPALEHEALELEGVDAEHGFFTAEDEAAVAAMLAAAPGDPCTLSQWLAALRAKSANSRALRLLVLRLLGAHGRDDGALAGRLTLEATGDRFIDCDFIGDDLALRPRVEQEI